MRWPRPVCARSISARHDADDGEHAAHDVVDRSARAQRPSRRPGHVGEPAHHLHDFVERRAVLVGAREEALERAVDRAADCRARARRSRARARPSRRAGNSRSARRRARSACWRTPCPFGALMSSARLRLLRLNVGKKPAPEPGSRRVLSPSPTGSTLITSAPRSARMSPQLGPITMCENSTTRMPASGSLMPLSQRHGRA